MTLRIAALSLLVASPLLGQAPARAIVHLWDIAEIYSNEDGSVQFVELFTKGFGEVRTQDGQLHSDGSQVGLLGPVAPPTTNRSFLLATPGFAELPGAVVPDTVMPGAPFFSVDGDTLVFQTPNDIVFDSVSFGPGELPVDGVQSLHRDNPGGETAGDPPGGLFAADNSPTNYAGDVGQLMLPEPRPSLLATTALLAVSAIARALSPPTRLWRRGVSG